MRYYRGAFGGVISYEYMKNHSPNTLVIIGINVAIYLLSLVLGLHLQSIYYGGMIPFADIILSGQYWRIFTSMFIHGDLMHVVFNMVILLHAGAYVEQFMGSKKFLGFYISTGILVAICTGFFSSGLTVGASGAIFALLGYILFYELDYRRKGISTYSMIVPLVVINVIFTLIDPRISIVGHLSGLIIGYLIPWLGNKFNFKM